MRVVISPRLAEALITFAWFVALLVVLVFGSSDALAADEDGYEYCVFPHSSSGHCGSTDPGWGDSKAEAITLLETERLTDFASWCVAPAFEWPEYPLTQSSNSGAFDASARWINSSQSCPGNATNLSGRIRCTLPGGCTPPYVDPGLCALFVPTGGFNDPGYFNTTYRMSEFDWTSTGEGISATVCRSVETGEGPTLCRYQLEWNQLVELEGVPTTFVQRWRGTGEGCASDEDADIIGEDVDALEAGSGDVTDCQHLGGTQVCVGNMEDPQHQANCGTINGEWVCVDSIPDDSCRSLANGGVVCVGSAAGPSVDSTPLDATVEFTRETEEGTVTVRYYTSSQVSSSDTVVHTSGSGGTGSGGGHGDGPEGSGGTGEGSALDEGDYCPPELDCELEGLGDMIGGIGRGEGGTGLFDRIEAFNHGVSAMSCPFAESVEVEILDGWEMSGQPICDFFDVWGALMRAMFAILWGFVALRVLLSA